MNFIIFFMYSFGPGQFFPGIIALVGHIIIMGLLHTFFVQFDVHPCSSNLTFGKRFGILMEISYSAVVNGLANIYCHNYVNTKTEQKATSFMHKKPTFFRQLIFDLIFLIENIAISIYASVNIQVKPFDDFEARLVLFGYLFLIHIIGILLKMVYYKFFHIWKDVTTRFDCQTKSFLRGNKKLNYTKNCLICSK